jgi:ADP-ribose pyrophosphatase YjhB (NUDIX family)
MRKHSCGAILYTIYKGSVYIILGKEHGVYFPFKGGCESGETFQEAAIREIKEETCGLVELNKDIKLDCHYSTSRKTYHIGLVYVDYDIVQKFKLIRAKEEMDKNRDVFLEKTDIRAFQLDSVFFKQWHTITLTPILYYLPILKATQNTLMQLKSKQISKKTSTIIAKA